MVSNGSKADHVRRADGECESVRRGDHPRARLISYADQATIAGAKPVLVSCPENNQFQAARARPRGGDHAQDQVGGAELPQQSDRRRCARAPRCATSPYVVLAHPHVLVMADDVYEHLTYDGFGFCTIAEVEAAAEGAVRSR